METLLNAPATIALIIANLLMSWHAFSNKPFYEKHLFRVGSIRQGKEWSRFVSSAFLHVNGIHLIINMYVLYEFGRILESVLGTIGFVVLYVVSLLAGNAWEYVANYNNPNYRSVGASGATSGIILAFCLFFPFATLLLFFVIPMWAIFLAVLFIGGSYYLSKKQNTMIAHGAHLGGALAGLVVAMILQPSALGNLIEQVVQMIGKI